MVLDRATRPARMSRAGQPLAACTGSVIRSPLLAAGPDAAGPQSVTRLVGSGPLTVVGRRSSSLAVVLITDGAGLGIVVSEVVIDQLVERGSPVTGSVTGNYVDVLITGAPTAQAILA